MEPGGLQAAPSPAATHVPPHFYSSGLQRAGEDTGAANSARLLIVTGAPPPCRHSRGGWIPRTGGAEGPQGPGVGAPCSPQRCRRGPPCAGGFALLPFIAQNTAPALAGRKKPQSPPQHPPQHPPTKGEKSLLKANRALPPPAAAREGGRAQPSPKRWLGQHLHGGGAQPVGATRGERLCPPVQSWAQGFVWTQREGTERCPCPSPPAPLSLRTGAGVEDWGGQKQAPEPCARGRGRWDPEQGRAGVWHATVSGFRTLVIGNGGGRQS